MPDVADVAAIEKIAEQSADKVVSKLTARIHEMEERVDDLASALRAATVLVTTMIEGLGPKARSLIPPRPPELDAACAAAPEAGPQRLEAEILGRPVVQYVEPGADPGDVWADMCVAVASQAIRAAAKWRT